MTSNTDFGSPMGEYTPPICNTMNPHDSVDFAHGLRPREYHIQGCDADSKIIFRDVNIIDSTGKEPFKGDVYIEGEPPRLRIKFGNEFEA